jgi:CAAX protease family protein
VIAITCLFFVIAVLIWVPRFYRITTVLFLGVYLWAAFLGYVHASGLVAVALLAVLSFFNGQRFRSDSKRDTGIIAFIAIGFALSMHLIPGFDNLLLLGPIRFTPSSVPFKMYLNLDKTAVGLVLFLFYAPLYKTVGVRRSLSIGLIGAVICVMVLVPIAVGLHAIRWDPKAPDHLWLWALHNFFLVALAEESFFRGFLQANISRWLANRSWEASFAIGFSALAFGLLHYPSGLAMVLFATIAGVIYGISYRLGGLLASMCTHFGLNLFHILLFTYPLLDPSITSARP